MKRISSVFLAMLLTLCCISPALAVDTDPDDMDNGNIAIEQTFDFVHTLWK